METDGEPAVGSPAWLELQHQKERAREGALTKPPTASAEVVLGAVLLLLGIVVNVVLAGGGEGALPGPLLLVLQLEPRRTSHRRLAVRLHLDLPVAAPDITAGPGARSPNLTRETSQNVARAHHIRRGGVERGGRSRTRYSSEP